MIKLNDYILESEQVINESFKASIFQEISNQLSSLANNDKKGLSSWYRPSPKTFKSLFRNYRIAWDKITDESFKECSSDDQKDIKLVKQICSNRSNSVDGMIILLNDQENDDEPKYRGCIIKADFNRISYYSFISSYSRDDCNDVKPSYVNEFITNKFYIVVFTDDMMTRPLKDERWRSQQGTIDPGNEILYNQMAERNRERYKQLISKMRAERDSTDEIPEKVSEYIKKVMDLVSLFSKEPIKYSAFEYDVQYLLDLIGDKKVWRAARPGGRKEGYTGSDGLLTVFGSYLKNKLSMAKGHSYGFEQKEYVEAKENIKKIFNTIDTKLEAINKKVSTSIAA